MFDVIMSNGNRNAVAFRNMSYVTALNTATHMNCLTTQAAKMTGKAIKTVFSIAKSPKESTT
jgi:hypothetical protein